MRDVNDAPDFILSPCNRLAGEGHFSFMILAYRCGRFNRQAGQFEKTDQHWITLKKNRSPLDHIEKKKKKQVTIGSH